MPIKRDYYDVLGLADNRSANEDEIKQAYRKLARKYHPDVSKEPDAEDRFKEVGEAYEVLKDPAKRSQYDQFGLGADQMKQSGGGPRWQAYNRPETRHYSSFSGRLGNTQFTMSGKAIQAITMVPLRTMLKGGIAKVQYPMSMPSGIIGMSVISGVREVGLTEDTAFGESRSFVLDNGNTLTVQFVPHQDGGFWVEDAGDIYTQITIDTLDAIVGGEVVVPHPAGTPLKIKVPENTSDETFIRIRGKGMKSALKPGGRGDFMINVAHHTRKYKPEQLVHLREALKKINEEMNPNA